MGAPATKLGDVQQQQQQPGDGRGSGKRARLRIVFLYERSVDGRAPSCLLQQPASASASAIPPRTRDGHDGVCLPGRDRGPLSLQDIQYMYRAPSRPTTVPGLQASDSGARHGFVAWGEKTTRSVSWRQLQGAPNHPLICLYNVGDSPWSIHIIGDSPAEAPANQAGARQMRCLPRVIVAHRNGIATAAFKDRSSWKIQSGCTDDEKESHDCLDMTDCARDS
nr:hypothetical protein CFP56_36247 [Quercus suber]